MTGSLTTHNSPVGSKMGIEHAPNYVSTRWTKERGLVTLYYVMNQVTLVGHN